MRHLPTPCYAQASGRPRPPAFIAAARSANLPLNERTNDVSGPLLLNAGLQSTDRRSRWLSVIRLVAETYRLTKNSAAFDYLLSWACARDPYPMPTRHEYVLPPPQQRQRPAAAFAH